MKALKTLPALLLLTAGAHLAFGDTPPAHYPGWWYDGAIPGTSIVSSTGAFLDVDNYAPASIGQLKWVATRAKTYLDVKLTAQGGAQIDLTGVFPPMPPGPGAVGHDPAAYAAAVAENYKPANLGQLKAVTRLFYTRLNAVGYDTRAYLLSQGYPPTWTGTEPWPAGGAVELNYAPANLGQLKLAFGFSLNLPPVDPNDLNGNGLPDLWESQYWTVTPGNPPGGQAASDDPDMDNLSNENEFACGTNPMDPDTDDDGMSDGDEVYAWRDPNHYTPPGDINENGLPDTWEIAQGWAVAEYSIPIGHGANDDLDDDGYSNLLEYQTGRNPNVATEAFVDSDGDGVPDLCEIMHGTSPTSAASVPNADFVVNPVGVVSPDTLTTPQTVRTLAELSRRINAGLGKPYPVVSILPGVYAESLNLTKRAVVRGATTDTQTVTITGAVGQTYALSGLGDYGFVFDKLIVRKTGSSATTPQTGVAVGFGSNTASLNHPSVVRNCVIAGFANATYSSFVRIDYVHCTLVHNSAFGFADSGSPGFSVLRSINQLAIVASASNATMHGNNYGSISSIGSIVYERGLTGVNAVITPDYSPRQAHLGSNLHVIPTDLYGRSRGASAHSGAVQLFDADGDTLSDRYETSVGWKNNSSDSDNDGLPDAFEFTHSQSNPLDDPDGDRLSNWWEAKLGTNPNVANPTTGDVTPPVIKLDSPAGATPL